MLLGPDLRPPSRYHRGALVWSSALPVEALSSAPVGGGRRSTNWVINMRVDADYARHDLEGHAAEVADAEDCRGSGITLFTAASVEGWCRGERQGVTVDATVGVSKPTWAADESQGHGQWSPGTINLVAWLPIPVSEAAAVNMVITATEAKTQALFDAGVPGTGTASDAMVLLWPTSPTDTAAHVEVALFGGPRSTWGSQLALATYDAVGGAITT